MKAIVRLAADYPFDLDQNRTKQKTSLLFLGYPPIFMHRGTRKSMLSEQCDIRVISEYIELRGAKLRFGCLQAI